VKRFRWLLVVPCAVLLVLTAGVMLVLADGPGKPQAGLGEVMVDLQVGKDGSWRLNLGLGNLELQPGESPTGTVSLEGLSVRGLTPELLESFGLSYMLTVRSWLR